VKKKQQNFFYLKMRRGGSSAKCGNCQVYILMALLGFALGIINALVVGGALVEITFSPPFAVVRDHQE